ncbi:MAG TPA: hypothetical protein VFP68_03525 [Burkholderiaceae bacterium]|nr:hypothetical protein [Burkholderiaceae bacterium]
MQVTIGTRAEYLEALRALIAEAADLGAGELFLCDPDFADWPLNEPAVIDHLMRWAAPHRRIALIAQHYDEVVRRHPRFVQWRQVWGHLVDARIPEDTEASDLPTLLLVPEVASLRLLDRRHWRAVISRDGAQMHLCRDELDAISQRSHPGFAARPLGL